MTHEHLDSTPRRKLSATHPPKLNEIIDKLCQGIETPQIRTESDGNEGLRLIELMESQSYPHAMLHCQHLEEKGIAEDCVDCQLLQYETYKSRFLQFVQEKGYEHTHTLKAAFDYYSTLITQYRLTEGDELLDTIYAYCINRGSWSSYYISAVQARAFLRFKQGRYQESLDYFKQQIDTQGPNKVIYENMALAYSRLNQFKEASACYAQAILLIRQDPEESQQFSSLLMGLSTVLDNPEESLIVLEESLKLLHQRFDKPHSLIAKALGAMGDAHMKLGDLNAAAKCYSEAIPIFIDTCGNETPLTSNAMSKYARVLLRLGNKTKAREIFISALQIWAKVDNESFDANLVAEAVMSLMNECNSKIKDEWSDKLIACLDELQKKIETNVIFSDDINVLCLLKFIYELYIVNGEIQRAKICCQSFRDSLNRLDVNKLGELVQFRDKFLVEVTELLQIIETIPPK
ncbi:MAG: tetratricopeptide repeat protein [Gammaproteobacteria bacterium]